jgi:2-C-methyl-D-erythritol 4-phosphate cytidylyltransferase
MATWCIVVAAGSGSRFGGPTPKQYERLGDRRVLDWSVSVARAACDRVVLVVPPDRVDDPEPSVDTVVAGGSTRSESVRAGLAAVPASDAQVILVHDAARPLAPLDLFARVIAAVRDGADAAVPSVAVPDTLKRVEGNLVVGTVDRDDVVAVQTPQGFAAPMLRRAHAGEASATDDAGLVEQAGGRVVAVVGDEVNRKITTVSDLAWAAVVLETGTTPRGE